MNSRDLLTSALTLRWSAGTETLEFMHGDLQQFPQPLLQIRAMTLDAMSFDDASKFIGETVVLLVPELRDRYVDPLSGERHDVAGA